MMSIYTGIRKRWIEGDYGGSYRPGEEGIEIRSQFFRKYLGRDNVMVPNVGFKSDGTARPLIIATDLLAGTLDQNGNQIEGASDGLYYPGLPDKEENEPTLEPLSIFLKRVKEEKLLSIFPGDQHENPGLFDLNRLTTTILDRDLSKLTGREQVIVERKCKNWIGKRLPAGIWKEIFINKTGDNPRGYLTGKESRNFIPHCTEGIVEYINPVLDLFNMQKNDMIKAINRGDIVPRARWLPIAKDGLTVDMPPDERGTGGNKLDELLKAAFTGGYFQGDDHRQKKRAIVVGACYEYSVRLLIEHLIDADINVIWLLTCTKGLDLFSSKLHTAHYLKELYGKKLFCTYEWITPLLGPEPPEWKKLKEDVMKKDAGQHSYWWKEYEKQMKTKKTSMGKNIFMSEQEVINEAKIC